MRRGGCILQTVTAVLALAAFVSLAQVETAALVRPASTLAVHPFSFWQNAGTPTPTPTPFSDPTTITGLKLWLKADSLGLSDGDSVSSWTDSSGLGNHATQATGGNQPIFKSAILNGLPIVRFDGVNDWLGFSLSVPGQFSAFVVAKRTTGGTSNYQMIISAVPPFNQFGTVLAAKADGYAGWGHYLNSWKATSYTTLDVWHVMAITTSGGTDTSTTDGAVEVHSDGSRGSSADGVDRRAIGGDVNFNSGWFSGDVAEILVYDNGLSSTNRKNLESYLGAKYGITITP